MHNMGWMGKSADPNVEGTWYQNAASIMEVEIRAWIHPYAVGTGLVVEVHILQRIQ